MGYQLLSQFVGQILLFNSKAEDTLRKDRKVQVLPEIHETSKGACWPRSGAHTARPLRTFLRGLSS